MVLHQVCRWAAAAALFVALPVSASAQGSQAQRDACTPDAFRLCGAYMPDPGRVEGCLRAAGPNLSRPCYDVFYPPQDVPPPQQKTARRRSNGPLSQPVPPPPPSQDDDD